MRLGNPEKKEKQMKITVPLVLTLMLAIMAGTLIGSLVMSNYEYENTVLSSWNLADKSSTIEAKAKYIHTFVETVETRSAEFCDHNAVFLATPDNSFDLNLKALKSLDERLTQISGMPPGSFEYQAAIQQITAQEQGEAHEMLGTLKGCWLLKQYPLIWSWIGLLALIATVLVGVCTYIVWCVWLDNM